MNEDEQVAGRTIDINQIPDDQTVEQYVTNLVNVVGGPRGWTGTPGQVGVQWSTITKDEQKEELYLREKSIEYTIQAVGFKEVDLPVFTAMLDYFYNYLKTGQTTKV